MGDTYLSDLLRSLGVCGADIAWASRHECAAAANAALGQAGAEVLEERYTLSDLIRAAAESERVGFLAGYLAARKARPPASGPLAREREALEAYSQWGTAGR